MRRAQRKQLLWILLIFSAGLVLPALAGSASEGQPLKVKLAMLTQRYCRGSGDVWAIWLKLQLQTTNITGRKLIVQKTIGRAWYTPIVARDEKALAEHDFEEAPMVEFAPTESEIRGPSQDLDKDFVILAPGESFEAESSVDLLVGAGAPSPTNKGLIRTGVHVLQLRLATWTYATPPKPFRDKWKDFGELLYETVKSEPLPLRVPLESEFENCRAK